MTSPRPQIAIPEPSSTDREYSRSSWPVYAKAVECAGGIPVQVPLGESQAALARLASSCSGLLLPGNRADLDPEKYGEQAIRECGEKDASRESADDLLLQDAFNLHKPIFGICYGMQSLNVWRNGSLIQDLRRYLPEGPVNHRARELSRAHPVTLAPGSGLAHILRDAEDLEQSAALLRLPVNSSHHQAVRQPGDQLNVVATSPEDGVIEAIEAIETVESIETLETLGGRTPEGRTAEQWAQFPKFAQFVLGVQWHPERTYDESPASRALFDAFIRAAASWRLVPIQDSTASTADSAAP